MIGFSGIVIFVLVALIFTGIRVLNEYERGVVLTLGRYTGTKGPGLVWVWPVIQRMSRVDLRTIVMDVPPQDVITRDNVTVKVNAVVYFRVVDPSLAILQVVHYYEATSQLAQTTLRSVLGQHDLDALLAEREVLNRDIQSVLDKATDAWGIKVTTVEIKPSASDAPRSSTPKASCRPRRSSPRPPGSSPGNRRHCSCATCRP
jgi:regulator of protease activity HflC (stomatin/prohibitin superfamily)